MVRESGCAYRGCWIHSPQTYRRLFFLLGHFALKQFRLALAHGGIARIELGILVRVDTSIAALELFIQCKFGLFGTLFIVPLGHGSRLVLYAIVVFLE